MLDLRLSNREECGGLEPGGTCGRVTHRGEVEKRYQNKRSRL